MCAITAKLEERTGNRADEHTESDIGVAHLVSSNVNGTEPSPNGYDKQSQHVTYTPFSISTELKQIPDDERCEECGGPTSRVNLVFKLSYTVAGQSYLAKCDKVPGYRCSACRISDYDPFVSLEVTIQASRQWEVA